MELNNVIFAFLLTLLAGLSTTIGGAIGVFAKRSNTKFLAVALGFSAGVMIYVSFVEILMKAFETLQVEMGMIKGSWIAVASFFIGMATIAIIDRAIPLDKTLMKSDEGSNEKKLMRMGIITALAMAIHNFPEGLVTFTSALKDPTLGVAIAIAIAIHNIPEGIAVSVPVYYATNNKKKAFNYAFLSGLAEPIGALLGYLVLMNIYNDIVFGIVFAFVGGIMVFISLDELLPTAREYGKAHLSIYGLIGGMIVMAVSLLLIM